MDPFELTTVISTVAIAIAKSIPDNEELKVWSRAFVQLATTLDTIAYQRDLIIQRGQGNLNQGNLDQTIIKDEDSLL